MRLTLQLMIDAINKLGPSTVATLAEHFSCDEKRMQIALGEWLHRGLITTDYKKPARWRVKPLAEIGRDELGRLSQPAANDPSPEEIRRQCLEIQKEWSPREEFHRRSSKPQRVEIQLASAYGESHGSMDFS